MNTLATMNSPLSSLCAGFFAPVSASAIDQLLDDYARQGKHLNQLSRLLEQDAPRQALDLLLEAGQHQKGRHSLPELGTLEAATKVLDSTFWRYALALTDILDHMPQARRSEWFDSIEQHDVPSFERETLIATLTDLLMSRDKFLAERIDGIFQQLSKTHVTNRPEGFGKRMISWYTNEPGYVDYERAGYLNDLRCVVARFMGRDEPRHDSSSSLLRALLRRTGEWIDVDGGALKIRLYKKGTLHVEVHPDMAWRLNEVLALLYPRAITASSRRPPVRQCKSFSLTQVLIPHTVLQLISDMSPTREAVGEGYNKRYRTVANTWSLSGVYGVDRHLIEQAETVLLACGAVKVGHHCYQFDYDFSDVRVELLARGSLPDQKAHQYYPSPADLGKEVVDWCGIESQHVCLEPQAGQGGLAQFMPATTLCIEVSDLHCQILRQKGFEQVVCADFIEWAQGKPLVDRIVMNPPFSQGRAEQHLQVAAGMLKKEGVLTAILPAGMLSRPELDGFDYEWREPDTGQFPGVSVRVVLLRLTRRYYA